MELIVDPIKQQKIIIKNKKELIKELKDKLVIYDKVITKDMITEGKQDRAKLNKLFTAIEDKRKDIKSEVMIPYNEIETDFKEITTLIKQASDKIDVQVKKFEENEKIEKKEKIKEYFDNVIDYDFIKFENIFNDKWLNISTSFKSIQEDIDNLKNKIETDLEAIKQLESKHETTLLSKYYTTRDIGAVIIEKSRLEKIEIEQQRKKELQEIAKQKLDSVIQTETVQKPIEVAKVINDTPSVQKTEEMYHRAFEVWGNREQIIALGNFMNMNNIKFKKIEGGI